LWFSFLHHNYFFSRIFKFVVAVTFCDVRYVRHFFSKKIIVVGKGETTNLFFFKKNFFGGQGKFTK